MLRTLLLATFSVIHFLWLCVTRQLHLPKDRLRVSYGAAGSRFRVFRETVSTAPQGEPCVLIVRFRLRLLDDNRVFHWAFQRLCIMTTPFWCGMPGFRVKLWMVDPISQDYLGIYDWRGQGPAYDYLRYLVPILRFCSVKGSVGYEMLAGVDMEDFLTPREI